MTLYTRPVSFFVPGEPAPQGSKIAYRVKNSRKNNIVESSKRVKPWRADVVAAVPVEFRFLGPVDVSVEFRFTRARGNTDDYPTAKNKGDLDKLMRAILDALTTSEIIEDDRFVVDSLMGKRYAVPGFTLPGAFISITEKPK